MLSQLAGATNPPSYGPFSAPVDINFTENVTAPNIVGNYSCTVTAVVDGDPRAEQVINVTVTPGPPNSITLTPPTALNVAGDEHCVTATVTDSFGNVVPGVPVTFAVNGADTAGGTVNTNAAGQATFCYTGTVAGNDTITATAQGGTNPTATAAKTYEPGPPASITLTPPTATNVVDDQHCVTATVKDQFGNVVPGATVNFGTAGSTSATVGNDRPRRSGGVLLHRARPSGRRRDHGNSSGRDQPDGDSGQDMGRPSQHTWVQGHERRSLHRSQR
ncbi:MAG: Ig-like domain-containing protein [Actinobacteria bacterium]|nr:Ig-like domain-containing protein [Actinomycetota bacterium]